MDLDFGPPSTDLTEKGVGALLLPKSIQRHALHLLLPPGSSPPLSSSTLGSHVSHPIHFSLPHSEEPETLWMVQHYIQAVENFFFSFNQTGASLDVPAGGLMTSWPGGNSTEGGAIDTRPQDWPVSGDVTGGGAIGSGFTDWPGSS